MGGPYAGPTGIPIAWLSLDEGDNDPVRFLSYLIAALRVADADIGSGILDRFRPPRPSGLNECLIALLNQISAALARRPQPSPCGLILILDDYHLIKAPQVHSLLAFLLDHLPARMHVVVAGRADPALPIARLPRPRPAQ